MLYHALLQIAGFLVAYALGVEGVGCRFRALLWVLSVRSPGTARYMHAQKPLNSSFLWFIFRILQGNPKKELLGGLWVETAKEFDYSEYFRPLHCFFWGLC